MDSFTIIFIALGLAMDSFAVSIAGGASMVHIKGRDALRIALYFGIFQAVMPVVGWLSGRSFSETFSGIDHWIAFAILFAVGSRMIYQSRQLATRHNRQPALGGILLLMLALATSIDALAVGFSFAFMRVTIVTPVVAIGVVAFLLSFAGVYLGSKMGHLFENRIELLGGALLILIGAKILVEHLGVALG